MTAPTTTRQPASRGKPDQLCADAVDLAREAVTEDVAGAHIEAVAEGERVVTHYFECTMPAYRGWRWAVTVARVPRGKQVTVCEAVLLPGPDALVTPDWVPWEDRVAPGDLGVGDLMPTAPDDERLAPGYLLSEDPAVEDVVWELGLGRVRVLSRLGRLDTAERWYEGDNGPGAPISTSAPAQNRCVTCGFYLPLAGSMRALFGACANMYAPDDGRVVSADHGCGAHSETLVEVTVEVDEAPTVYDDGMVDRVDPDPSARTAAAPGPDTPEALATEPTTPEAPEGVIAEPTDEVAPTETTEPEPLAEDATPDELHWQVDTADSDTIEALDPEADSEIGEDIAAAPSVADTSEVDAPDTWAVAPSRDADVAEATTTELSEADLETVDTDGVALDEMIDPEAFPPQAPNPEASTSADDDEHDVQDNPHRLF